MLSTASMRRTPAAAGTAPPLVPGRADDAHATDVAHAAFLGMPFALWTQAEVIEAIAQRHGAPYRYVVTPNVSHVVAAHNEPDRLMPIYRDAWLSLCDSRILRALARLDRLALPLVTGSDLVATLLATLNAQERPGAPPRILVVGPPHSAALCASAIPP
jgi:UDP-N-acetyl-D-mannosaminuronic acid transferase (WecB/TagA/CpsF family)